MAPTFEREFEVPDIELERECADDPLYAAGPEFVRDFLRGAIVTIPVLVSLIAVSQLAFARRTRKEIFRRDEATCQSPECVGYIYDEVRAPRSMHFDSPNGGWMVTAAHLPDEHLPYRDHRPEAGRCLCTCCHVIEELRRGNKTGASQLYKQTTQRNIPWMRSCRSGDEKIPFDELQEIAKSRGKIPKTKKRRGQKQKTNGRGNRRSRFHTSWG